MDKHEKQVVKGIITLLKSGKLRHYSGKTFKSIGDEVKVIINGNVWITYGNHEASIINAKGFIAWKLRRAMDRNVEKFPSVDLSRLAIELDIHGEPNDLVYKIGKGCEPTQDPSVVRHTESGRYISANWWCIDHKDTFKLGQHDFCALSDMMVFNKLKGL